ncbi:thiol-disulfide isomerase/thioredoxin [Bacillus thermophilus]|uniref:Thiol-disulfide isomerase/thioredoxin n=1 Tax=Siminovitchia thermophila TaxID=1245522 RepID=A0ABS2R6I2_9BACI|nr:TlpA disulfide reductase family protein [Siminovitchia thermophila]MBM7715270.1 thiol-disulfide isomerase/thioredoxin [Siminovitchia thermophila]
MKWRWLLLVGLVAFMGIFLYKEYIGKDKYEIADESQMDVLLPDAQAESGQEESGLSAGIRPPAIELPTLDGQQFRLADYKGKIVILNFWATWCPPCRAEMPDMQKFYQNYKDKGVEIVAVNLTAAENNKEVVQTFIDEFNVAFTIPLDETGMVGQQFEAFAIPKSFIIDQEGVIQQGIIGPMTYQWMENEVNKLQ